MRRDEVPLLGGLVVSVVDGRSRTDQPILGDDGATSPAESAGCAGRRRVRLVCRSISRALGVAVLALVLACSDVPSVVTSTPPEATTTSPDDDESYGVSTTAATLPVALDSVVDELGCDRVRIFDYFNAPIRSAVAKAGIECTSGSDTIHVFERREVVDGSPWADEPLGPYGRFEGQTEPGCSDWLLVNERLVIVVAGPEVADRTARALSEPLDTVQSLQPPSSYGLPSGCGGAPSFGNE